MAGRGARAPQPLAAYVLHHYDWSETSVILDLFTRDLGRVIVAAKGAKRPYSQLRSVLLPLQRVNATLGRAAADADETREVHNLRAAEYGGGAPMPSGDALLAGLYLNELLMKLLERHDPHPALFDAYAETVAGLGPATEPQRQAGLRAFELRLLAEIGLLPELDVVTATQQSVREPGRYGIRPEVGVIESADPASLAADALVRLQAALVHGRVQGGMAALQAACAPDRVSLRTMLRELLHYHLGSPRLRTRDVMIGVHRLLDSGTG